jgi:hypothetical protein
MLNIEYYKDKLVELGIIDIQSLAIIQGQPHICKYDIMCDKCLFNNHSFSCPNDALDWLFSEYKESEIDWSKVEVDTPILVRDYESNKWTKRYFARFEDGKVYAWQDGATSWTADGEYNVNSWQYAKLAESEE